MTSPTVTERDRWFARDVVEDHSLLAITAEAFARARAEADAAGYARGRAEMRERAAKVADDRRIENTRTNEADAFSCAAEAIAAAIRALED